MISYFNYYCIINSNINFIFNFFNFINFYLIVINFILSVFYSQVFHNLHFIEYFTLINLVLFNQINYSKHLIVCLVV